jgi:hypothetical protein
MALCATPGLAFAGEPFEGVWDSPLGRIKIDQERDGVVGRLAEASRACGFAKNTEVLRGKVVDEVFTGEVKVCFAAKCPDRDGWVFAMAAAVDSGPRLVGALAPGRCTAAFKEKPFLLAKRAADAPADPLPPVADAPPKARKLMHPDAQRLYREGMEYSGAGRYDVARQRFMSANQIEPKNAEILNQIGVTYYARNDFPSAELYYRRALGADGSSNTAWYNLACVLAKEGKAKEALKALKSSVETGFSMVSTLDEDHDLDPLRDDPSFQDIRALARRNAARGGK